MKDDLAAAEPGTADCAKMDWVSSRLTLACNAFIWWSTERVLDPLRGADGP